MLPLNDNLIVPHLMQLSLNDYESDVRLRLKIVRLKYDIFLKYVLSQVLLTISDVFTVRFVQKPARLTTVRHRISHSSFRTSKYILTMLPRT
jgi:hypothetical protein